MARVTMSRATSKSGRSNTGKQVEAKTEDEGALLETM